MIASGDGAGPSAGEKNAAGAGGVIYLPASAQRAVPRIHLIAEPVVCTAGGTRQPGYKGATRPTNNAGELLALEAMAREATELAQPHEHIKIQSDSRVALLASHGALKVGGARKRNTRRDKKALDMPLIVRAREAVRHARKRAGHKLTLRKVKGHSGSIWNEIADALAAIGRTIATGRQPVTAELLDRVKRAIEAIGGDEAPDVTCQGFAWT